MMYNEMAEHVTDSLNFGLKLQVSLKLAVEAGIVVPLKRTQAVLRLEDKTEQVESTYKCLRRTKAEAIQSPFQLKLKHSELECTKIQQAEFEQQNLKIVQIFNIINTEGNEEKCRIEETHG